MTYSGGGDVGQHSHVGKPQFERVCIPCERKILDEIKRDAADLDAENARLKGLACLICGRDTPCKLDTNKDNDPNWPGSPCTFDPSPIDAARRFMEERDEALAENARLQARVEWAMSMPLNERIDALVVSRDRYKALAERRGERLMPYRLILARGVCRHARR